MVVAGGGWWRWAGLGLAELSVTLPGVPSHPLLLLLCRPGRFDVVLFVPPPDEQGRLQALQVSTEGAMGRS